MHTRSRVLVLMCGLMPLAHALAHHSAAMFYDLRQHVTVQGVVTNYELGNPHLRILFDVDRNGTIEKWLAEGGSRTVLLRKGWTGKELAPGDKVVVRGHPARDGSKAVHVEYLILPDGRELFAEDFPRPEALEEKRRQERRQEGP
jgi:hypothetical protein